MATLKEWAAADDATPAGAVGSPSGRRAVLPFDAVARVSGALRVVTVHGELDVATRHQLAAAVAWACCPGADLDERAASNGLLLDLARLSFCDASGLTELAATHRRVTAYGLVLHVGAPAAAAPRRLLRLAVDRQWIDPVFAPSAPEPPPADDRAARPVPVVGEPAFPTAVEIG